MKGGPYLVIKNSEIACLLRQCPQTTADFPTHHPKEKT